MPTLDPRTHNAEYRPEVGQQIWASVRLREEPELLTVAGYSHNARGIEIIEYTLERCNYTLTSHLNEVYFYPDVAIDVGFVYEIHRSEPDGYDNTEEYVVAYCFDPEQTMNLIDALERENGCTHRAVLYRAGKYC